MSVEESAVVVIGAGQAGLSSAYFLRRFGVEAVVLDAEDGPGGAWRHRSPSLTMDKVHGIFDLPGHPKPADGGGVRPAAEVVPAYFDAYERAAGLHVVRPVRVTSVREGARGGAVARRDGRGGVVRRRAGQRDRYVDPSLLAVLPGGPPRSPAAGCTTPTIGGRRSSRGGGWSWWAAGHRRRTSCRRSRGGGRRDRVGDAAATRLP
ncbi:hypothetical protein GCM10020001_090250 [Nonomuraea salmonea]